MNSAEASQPRRMCFLCRRPESACYCRYLCSIETQTRVVLLQHPRERDVPFGTARMASLCLPNSGLYVGYAWEDPSMLSHELSHPDRPAMLLYPDELARDVSSNPPPGPVTLVVVDGTWPNTRKMVKRSALLRDLPRIAFAPARPSEYRIRREPRPDCVSTIEALAHVLGALEGDPERFERLLLPFRKMVEQQVGLIQKYKRAKTLRRPLRQSARSKAVGALKARAREHHPQLPR